MQVCREQQDRVPAFRAVMLGVGPELDRLRSVVKREKLPIELAGYVDDATKFDLLSRTKLFVFPSVEEGWGIAIAEALAVGTPVVAYDLPVYAGVFGDQLHTTPLKDVGALTRTVANLLDDYAASPTAYEAEQHDIAAYADQFRVEHVAAREYQFMEN